MFHGQLHWCNSKNYFKPWNGAKTKCTPSQATNLGGTSLHEKKQAQDT